MVVRLGKWLVVAALIISVGGHWAFLQTVAWAGMAVSFAEQDSVTTALVKIFNGKNPCKLCKFVSEGKASEKKSETQVSLKKWDSFAYGNSEFWFPSFRQTPAHPLSILQGLTEPPPTPPPLLS